MTLNWWKTPISVVNTNSMEWFIWFWLKFFNHFLFKKISQFCFQIHTSWRIQFFSILFAQTFLSLKSNAKLKVSVISSSIFYEKEKKGRKTDVNFMKCQTFFDSCQIFHHFDFLSNMENNVKFFWYILM